MTNCNKDDRRGIGGGVMILGLGLYFLAVNNGYLPPVEDSWPVILILVGLALIFGNLFRRKSGDQESNRPGPTN
jgi:hypothetical protein